jgi:CBS-domain-containing membrane protein
MYNFIGKMKIFTVVWCIMKLSNRNQAIEVRHGPILGSVAGIMHRDVITTHHKEFTDEPGEILHPHTAISLLPVPDHLRPGRLHHHLALAGR